MGEGDKEVQTYDYKMLGHTDQKYTIRVDSQTLRIDWWLLLGRGWNGWVRRVVREIKRNKNSQS